MPISDIADAFRKLKGVTENDIYDAARFLAASKNSDATTALRQYLASPRAFSWPATLIAIKGVALSSSAGMDFLYRLYDDTANEQLAIALGRFLWIYDKREMEGQGRTDLLSLALGYERKLAFGDVSPGEFSETDQDFKNEVLKVMSNNAFKTDLLSAAEKAGQSQAQQEEDAGLVHITLARDCPFSFENLSELVNKDKNGFDILDSWIDGLCSKPSSDKKQRDHAFAAAKAALLKNMKLAYGFGNASISKDLSNRVVQLAFRINPEFAKYFCSDLLPAMEEHAPEIAEKLSSRVASSKQKFELFKRNPKNYVAQIQSLLLDPNSNDRIEAIIQLLPAIYAKLDQGVIDSIWESGNEAVRLAVLQAIGKTMPSSKLIFIYENGSAQIKAAVTKILTEKKQTYLLPTQDKEM